MRKLIIIVLSISIISVFAILYISFGKNSIRNEQNTNSNTVEESSNTKIDTQPATSFIERLRAQKYEAGQIKIEKTLTQTNSYTNYFISYTSDNLKIYGVMNVPTGEGPFPVIILNHGYFNASSFNSGDGTKTMADILASNGYITLASDYRGHGDSGSDGQRSGHRPEYAIDVLNLIYSVGSIPEADVSRVGMWGHSMGGEVALRVAEATDQIKSIVLWAPTSGRVSDNARFYGGNRNKQTSENPDTEGTSPINYLHYISAPISLHQGLSDTEVDPEWSKELNKELQGNNKSVEYFEYPEQDHNFRNLGWDLISERTIEFFDRYLKSEQD